MNSAYPLPSQRWVGASAERVIAARGDSPRLMRLFDRSPVPLLLVDGERRYVHVNRRARLAFRLGLEEMRRLRIEDLTPPHFQNRLEDAWEKLTSTGVMAGIYDIASPAGTSMIVTYYAMADALPGLYLIAFAPEGWSANEVMAEFEEGWTQPAPALRPRELQVLELAAEGRTVPMIATELILSPATIKTHFENAYTKLEVGDRAAAVAKAMRLGLIV